MNTPVSRDTDSRERGGFYTPLWLNESRQCLKPNGDSTEKVRFCAANVRAREWLGPEK